MRNQKLYGQQLNSVNAILFVIALLLGVPGPALAGENKAPAQQAATPPAFNAITQAAAKGGVVKCLPRMDQLTTFVTSDSQNGALLFLAPSEPDVRLSSISLEVQTPSALSYVDANVSPGSGNSCGGSYEAVTYWASSCQEVASKTFSAFKLVKPLRQAIAVLHGGDNVRVFLMQAGQGCVSIKKEVLY